MKKLFILLLLAFNADLLLAQNFGEILIGDWKETYNFCENLDEKSLTCNGSAGYATGNNVWKFKRKNPGSDFAKVTIGNEDYIFDYQIMRSQVDNFLIQIDFFGMYKNQYYIVKFDENEIMLMYFEKEYDFAEKKGKSNGVVQIAFLKKLKG